jgi:hypothetical protein
MRLHQVLIPSLVLGCLGLLASSAEARGTVHLELVGDPAGGSPLAFQEWLQALTRAGIKDARLRKAESSDKPNIEVRGSKENPIYLVTGVFGGRDEIILPGARFKRSETKQLAQWLKDLAENGPVARREPRAHFGLTESQLEDARSDLAKPVGFSTQGMNRIDVVEKIRRKLGSTLQVEGNLAGGAGGPVVEELPEVASGTALACILRPAGFCMVPRDAGGKLVYVVSKAQLGQEVWPIGWPPETTPAEALPVLFEYRNVNVQGVATDKLLEAVAAHIKVPMLVDHVALARHGIDPTKKLVSHPQQRTNYSIALRKMLFQAGLKFEVRVDEANKAFLWITTVKPV